MRNTVEFLFNSAVTFLCLCLIFMVVGIIPLVLGFPYIASAALVFGAIGLISASIGMIIDIWS